MPVQAAVAASGRLTSADLIEVAYVGAVGERVVVPLRTSFQARFEDLSPVLPPQSFKGQRNFSGQWWFASTRSHVAFRSWMGRDRLIEFDFDPCVAAVAFRPMTLRWRFADVIGQHTPDYFVRRVDGSVAVFDVRTSVDLMPDAMVDALSEVGWQYTVTGSLDQVKIANLRWLAGYRHPRCTDPVRRDALLAAFAVPRALDEAARIFLVTVEAR